MPLFQLPDDREWSDVVGYEGIYKVNRDGFVKRVGCRVKTKSGHYQSYPERVLKPYKGQVYLSKDGNVNTVRVCDIVAEAFLAGYHKGDKVYHISGDSDRLDNLSLSLEVEADDSDYWRYVCGYEDKYQVSRQGEVRSVDRVVTFDRDGVHVTSVRQGMLLKQHVGDDGYLHCMLSSEGVSNLRSVHRLVAEAFLPNPDHLPQVNHKNGNMIDNRVDNLEWCTPSQNMQHARDTGMWDPSKCGNISMINSGIRVRCIDDGREFDSISSAAKYYSMDFESVKESMISGCVRKGHTFERLDK